jgi:chemotaxis protein MotB
MADGTPIIIKKKKIVAGGHHGGSWKVAYADFVTAMMAFFMVMWIMGMDQSTRSMIQGYFNDPFGMLKSPPKSQSAFAMPGSPRPKDINGSGSGGGEGDAHGDRKRESEELGELRAKIKDAVAKETQSHPEFKALMEHLETEITGEGLRVEFVEAAGSVFFLSGQSTIRPEAEALISYVAPILARSKRPMIVEGHTDATAYPSLTYTNWDLSADRALEMRRMLTRYGVPIKQFTEVRGYADTKLKFPESPKHFANRRVTLLLPFRTADPVKSDLPKNAFGQPVQGAFVRPIDLDKDGRVHN